MSLIYLAEARKTPHVLTAGYIMRLSEANEAVRQLRRLGCRILSVTVGCPNEASEIRVDRNPHQRLTGCWGVHVTCGPRL